MVLRVERYAVISLAFPNRIATNQSIGRRINDGENILVLQVDVNLARHRVVLRHSRFTVEVQSVGDFILPHIHDGLCLSAFIGDVQLVKRRSASASVRFRFRFQFPHNLHLLEVHYADDVVMSVRGVELLE